MSYCKTIDYQDAFFFLHYTYPATQKMGINLAMMRNLSNDGESLVEYLTCLTSYIFSITPQAQVNGMTFGKGDVVPFLYFKDRNHANLDVRHDSEALMDIAKYAYVALIEGWCTLPTPYHLWENEYNWLFGNYEPENLDYDLETLHQWYDETYEKYKNDRGVKQNPLIGSDIDTIISSNYTINYQVEATKDYVENIYAELGIDMTVDDFMARNALMAEYMMEHSNFDDVIKDYNVSIKFVVDNLQRGTFEEKNGTTAVLSDFQTIEFDDTIEKVASQDKDNDTLTNKAELGDAKWQDITGFVEKMYISKYGTNMTMYESKVYEMVINNGGYIDFNGNFVFGHIKMEKDLLGNIKVFYRVYDYKSNPVLKDTDFDGMDDAADSRPKDNRFHGTAKIERNQNLKVDYHNDYRHFYIDNNKYNSELAEMSLIISNLANDENRKLHIYQGGDSRGISTAGRQLIGDMTITQYLSKIGFIPLGNIPLYDGDGKCYLYYKIINYYGEEKLVFGIFIGGFNNERAYRELVVNNDGNKYQSIINAITNQVKALKGLNAIKDYFNNNKYCYWITGKNISGAIATGVASELGDAHNTYCYIYGVPNVKGTSILTYIKNIVNEDDLLPKIHSGIGQEGDVYNKSIYWDLIPEYRHYVESPNKYKGNFKRTNNVQDAIKEVKDKLNGGNTLVEFNNGLAKYIYNLLEERNSIISEETIINNSDIREEVSEIVKYKEEVLAGNSTKAYWCLVKTLDGYDSKYYYGYDQVYDKKETKPPNSDENIDYNRTDLVDIVKEMGKWYVNNVYTYQAGRYGAETADNITGAITYYTDEQEYQDKFKERFRESWNDSSDTAKANRRNYMKDKKNVPDEKIDLIMQDFNVEEARTNGTFAELSVDILKKNEKYTTIGRLEQLTEGKTPTLFGYYYNELVKKNVQDDCSSFVSAVLYLFVNNNKEIPAEKKYTNIPNYTSAKLLRDDIRDELIEKGFKCYEYNVANPDDDYNIEKANPLQEGDILVRNGHVEFYLDEDWSFGWGQVHTSYENNPHSKSFKWHFGTEDEVAGSTKPQGYYFYNLNRTSEGNYTRVYRYGE